MRRIRRARASVGAAFADGHGTYLLAMIAFGAAATFLHHALAPERLYHDALGKLITVQQEPFRGETHSVLAAGLLPDSASQDICKDRALLAETDRIAKLFSASLAAPPAASEKLVPCEPSNRRCPKLTAQVGVAMTDLAEHSTLFVPSTIAALVQADPKSVALLLASRRLEDHRQALGQQFRAGTLATMYFITLAGAIRLLPVTSLQGLPAHRTFAGAGYVYTTLSGDVHTTPSGAVYTTLPGDVLQCPGYGQSRTLTRPYFDVMDFGLVRTLCQRIIAPPDNVVGTMCFDVTPRETVTYQMLADASQLFDLQVVRLYDQGGFDLCQDIEGCLPERLSSFGAAEVGELQREWRTPRDAVAAGGSAVRMFRNETYFAAKIDHRDARDNVRGWDTLVFGRVRRSLTGDIASAIAMLVFAAIACAVIIRGVRRKARRLDFTLIRGLQVGVVELNVSGVIVGANDRAEEILGMELPSFGGSGEAVLFSKVIDPRHVIMLDDAGLLPDGPVTFSRYEQIDDLRRAGDSSSYYAFTSPNHRVPSDRDLIRVTGSTFVSSQSLLHTFGTIDTYIDEAHRKRIQAALAELPPTPSRSGIARRGR